MTVDIGAVRWIVALVEDVRAEVRRTDPDEADTMWGCLDEKTGKIFIEKSDPRRQAATLLHEMLHAAGLGEDQEDLVLALENMIFPTLWAQGWRPFATPSPRRRAKAGTP